SSASSIEVRMSLTITAVGPLNVLTNPTLIEYPAIAEFASAIDVIPASQSAALIFIFLLVICYSASRSSFPVRAASAPAPGLLLSRCPVFCARHGRSAASTNDQLPLRTFGALHP